MRQKVTALLRMVPMIVVMGTIFFLSNQPGDSLSLPPIPGIDKLAHMIAYGVLAGTVLFAHNNEQRHRRPRRVMVFTVIFCLLYGISDEFHQSFIPGRTASVYDLFADCGGAAMSCLFWTRWRQRIPVIRSL
jgi:VanZ family protein